MDELAELGWLLKLYTTKVSGKFPSYSRLCELEQKIKRHMVLYYILGRNEIEDWEYDLMVRDHAQLCEDWGQSNPFASMVGCDIQDPRFHKPYHDITGEWPCTSQPVS